MNVGASRRWAALTVVVMVAGCGTRIPHSTVVALSDGGALPTAATAVTSGDAAVVPGPVAPQSGAAGTFAPGQGSLAGGAAAQIPAGGIAAPQGQARAQSGNGIRRTGPSGAPSASAANAGGNHAPAPAPILLGMIGSFSGVLADGGQAGHDSILAWEHWVNARGGVDGHQVTVFTEDDSTDGATALSDAKDLVENKHVVAFVGNMQYSTMSAIEPYLRDKGVPVIGGDQSTPVWWASPILFPLGYGPNIGAWAEATIAVNSNKRNIGILYCAESAACSDNETSVANDPAIEQTGAHIAYTAQISVAQPDFTAECLGAQQKSVGVLLVFADTSSVRRVADSCARQGYFPTLGSGNADDSIGQDSNVQDYEQLTPVLAWTQANTPNQQEYAQFVGTYNLPKNLFSTMEFASGKMFERVMLGVKGPVTTAAILQAVWSIRNEDLGGLLPGPVSYRPNQAQLGSRCVIEQVLQNGHLVVGNNGKPYCRP